MEYLHKLHWLILLPQLLDLMLVILQPMKSLSKNLKYLFSIYLLFVVHDKTYDKHDALVDELFVLKQRYFHIQIFPIIVNMIN
jgi:hypothetical protein